MSYIPFIVVIIMSLIVVAIFLPLIIEIRETFKEIKKFREDNTHAKEEEKDG